MSYPVPPAPFIPPNFNAQSGYVGLLETGELMVLNGTTLEGALTATTVTATSVTAGALLYSGKLAYTQVTSNVTAVPITSNAGSVTTLAFTTASAGTTSFNLTGSVILSTSQVMVEMVSYAGTPYTNGVPVLTVTPVTAGVATVNVTNYGANALAGALVFNYVVV